MVKLLILLLALTIATVTAQLLPKLNSTVLLSIPKLNHKEFSWSAKPLSSGGKPNGVSATGTWRPANTRNIFTGTGSWQRGNGLGGSVKGTFGIGKGSSLSLGIGGGGGKGFHASFSARIPFRRKRTSEVIRKMFAF